MDPSSHFEQLSNTENNQPSFWAHIPLGAIALGNSMSRIRQAGGLTVDAIGKLPGRKLGAVSIALASLLGGTSDTLKPDTFELHTGQATRTIDDTLTIMTANVHGWENPRGGSNFDAFMNVLGQEDPDVVCLQEVPADGLELRELYQAGYGILFTTTVRDMGQREGNAVISKAHISLQNVVELPYPETDVPRSMLSFTIQTNSGPVSAANFHLSYRVNEAVHQASYVMHHVDDEDMPKTICGDLNKLPELFIDRLLGETPTTLDTHIPDVDTFPAHHPKHRLDYVVSGCGYVNPSDQKILDIESDHMAVIETIDITDCTAVK